MVQNSGFSQQHNFLIIFCHPKKESFCNAIKEAVIRGLKRSRRSAEIRVHDLYGEAFNPLLCDIGANERNQATIEMKNDVMWAHGIVFVAPVWWANVPAMLKGFFDRVFTEHFAFQYNQAGIPVGLLKGKKALLLCTCDTPSFLARFTKTSLGLRSVLRGILEVSGITDCRFVLFGSLLTATAEKRRKWISQAERYGEAFARPDRGVTKARKKIGILIRAARLPFFSFVFGSLFLGTAIASSVNGEFHWRGFIIAIGLGLMCHIAVSYSNEASDEQADKRNVNRTMFNGGTGLLAEGLISKQTLQWGWVLTSFLCLALAALFVFQHGYHWALLLGTFLGLFLGLEYSLPPLRLSRIGLGEIAAFAGYGIPMMVIGLASQGGYPLVSQVASGFRFYLLSLPISLSVLATICLTQIPDRDADREAGKRSIALLLPPGQVMALSASILFLCAFLCLALVVVGLLPLAYAAAMSLLPMATGWLIVKNPDAYRVPAGMTMIKLMGMSATATVICGIIPAAYFFNNPVQATLLK